MVDRREADAWRVLLDTRQRHEIDIVDRAARPVAVDEVDEAAADPLDRRDVQLHRPDAARDRLGAQFGGAAVRGGGVADAERDRADAGSVQPGEALREALGLSL